jgi:hypothetical protein
MSVKKIRMSTCFQWTAEVDDDSDEHVQVQGAKDAMHFCLPDALDGVEFVGCTIQGCNNVTSENL